MQPERTVVPFPQLRGGGDPPDNDGMEQRLKNLETFAFEANGRLARVETKLDHIDREVSQTKWWLAGSAVAIILTTIGTVIGTGVGIQQMTVAAFQGGAQAAKEAAPAAQQPIIINVPAAPAPSQKP